MKYVLSVAAVLLLLITGGVAYLYFSLDMETVRTQIAEKTLQYTGKTLLLEKPPVISLTPPGIDVGAATWGYENGEPAREGISVSLAGGTVRLSLTALLGGRVEVTSITLEQPEITIKTDGTPAAGGLSAGDTPAGGQSAESSEKADVPPLSRLRDVALHSLEIRQGSVFYYAPDGALTKAVDISLGLTDFALDSKAAFSLQALVYHGETAAGLAAAGDLTPQDGQIAVSAKNTITPENGLEDMGKIAFLLKGTALLPAAPAAPSFSVDISDGTARWRTLPLTFSASAVSQGPVWNITPFKLGLSEGSVTGQLTTDTKNRNYTLTATAENIMLQPLLEAVKPGMAVQGTARGMTDLKTRGSTVADLKKNLDGSGEFHVQHIQLGSALLPDNIMGVAVPRHFDSLSAPFTVKSGVMRFTPVVLVSPAFAGRGQGTADLPRERLDASATVAWSGLTIPLVASGPFNDISAGLAPEYSRQLIEQGVKSLLAPQQSGGTSGDGGTLQEKTKQLFKGFLP